MSTNPKTSASNEALQRSEALFRAIVESTTDCVLVWDRKYNYLYANRAAIDHVCTTRDKVIGKNIRDALGHIPGFMRLWMSRVDQVFATGTPMSVEDAVPVGDRLVYSESRLSPIRDANGNPFAVGVVYRDVTERKQAQESLRQNRARLMELVESIPMGIGVSDLNGNIEYLNPQFIALFKYPLEEITDVDHWFCLAYPNPNYRQQVMAAWNERLAEATAANHPTRPLEVTVTCKDGTLKEVEVNGIVIGNKLFTLFTDLSQRKAAEKEKHKLTTIIENTGDFMGLANMQGEILYLNPAARKILGWKPSRDLHPRHMHEIHPHGVATTILKNYIPQAIKEGTWIGETAILSTDGREIPVSQLHIAHRPLSGNVELISTIIRDISNQKQVEAELIACRDHLEERVEQRTAQLEQEIVVRKQAERQIAASLNEKEALLREIHHRVKNNLNTVSNLLYLQSRTIEDVRVTTAFRESHNRILTMARVHEHLYRSRSLSRIDMTDYLNDLTTDLAEAFPFRNVIWEIDANGVQLEIDRAIPCGLLVTEMVSNALKYAFNETSREGWIVIYLTVQGQTCRLVVADNGTGLPVGRTMGDSATLGLRLVEMLVRQLHGTYDLSSAPGEGTRFCVCFRTTETREDV